MTKMTDLLGSYDNLDETPKVLNNPSNILAVTISFMILTWFCALLRLYTRFFILRTPGWDDLFVIMGLLSTSVGSATICLAASQAGMGRHYLLISQAKEIEYLKIFYVANATYPGSAGYIKLALLLQYLRVYERTSPMRPWVIVTAVVVALWCVVYSVLAWVPTIPVRAYWDLDLPAVRYAFGSIYVEPFVATYTSLTATNMVLDMIILAQAAPLLLKSKADSEQSRWALLSLFGLGSMASIFSIWRLASIVETRATTFPTFDPTWYGSTPIVLAALEVDIAVIAAALPVFWPVLRNLRMEQILITREVKVTLEHRRISTGDSSAAGLGDADDEGIELQRSKSGLQFHSSGEGGSGGQRNYYGDPYVAQQVNPFRDADGGGGGSGGGAKGEFGTNTEVGVANASSKASIFRGKDL